MGAQTRTDVLPYISLILVFGYLWPGTSTRFLTRTARSLLLPYRDTERNNPKISDLGANLEKQFARFFLLVKLTVNQRSRTQGRKNQNSYDTLISSNMEISTTARTFSPVLGRGVR